MATPARFTMKATEPATGERIPLALHERMLGMYFNVTFALLFRGTKASPSALAAAFAKVLNSYQVLSGRLTLQDGALSIVCNNEGVPLTHDVQAGAAPPFDAPIPAALFDMAVDSVPTGEDTGDAPMRVKVTDFDDAQVMAISLNHGLCDANGIGAFMAAWAEAFSGGEGRRSVNNDRVGMAPPSPALGSPPLTPPEDVPADHPWRKVRHLPEQCPSLERVPLASPVLFSATKSAEECASLKARCVEAAAGEVSFVSTNDALCAELAASLGLDGEHVPFGLLVDFRSAIGAEAVFGNMWTTVEVLARNSLAGAADVRQSLPVAQSPEFIRWNAGQGANMAWPGKLLLNTWTKAFKLADLAFACAPSDVMLGAPMLEQRMAMMAPAGVCYVIMLPQSDGGVKILGVMPAAAVEKLTVTRVGGAA